MKTRAWFSALNMKKIGSN